MYGTDSESVPYIYTIGGSRIFGWVVHMNINEGRGTVKYKRINCSYMYTASFE